MANQVRNELTSASYISYLAFLRILCYDIAMLLPFLNFLEREIGSRDIHLTSGVGAHCSKCHPCYYLDSFILIAY